ncbi:hypothetical protein A7A78_08550 [Aequorivita soesokkakensis]|uniref:DUF4369 domain-containing protein n=1 Tax=Aequorivita soesokkakensis TaxID=1385699 RepID=A0A1A9LG49_9FLAO|nr:hypothetical protein A7A78_08550 [Aequorivita soesokkakensis]
MLRMDRPVFSLRKLCFFSIFLLFSSVAYCCTCKDYRNTSVLERINTTDAIFEGTVSKIDTLDKSTISITFSITRKIKGVDSLSSIKIQTAKSGSSCGSHFEVDEHWLIFSNSQYTGLCYGNLLLYDNSFKDFNLEPISKNYKFYYTKLKKFINQIADAKTEIELTEVDENNTIIAKGKLDSNRKPMADWFYVKYIPIPH